MASASQVTRDSVWPEVIRRARRNETWLLAAAGMASPALRNIAGGLARGFGGDVEELDAQILAGLLAHMAVVDVESPGMMTNPAGLPTVRATLSLSRRVGQPSTKRRSPRRPLCRVLRAP